MQTASSTRFDPIKDWDRSNSTCPNGIGTSTVAANMPAGSRAFIWLKGRLPLSDTAPRSAATRDAAPRRCPPYPSLDLQLSNPLDTHPADWRVAQGKPAWFSKARLDSGTSPITDPREGSRWASSIPTYRVTPGRALPASPKPSTTYS